MRACRVAGRADSTNHCSRVDVTVMSTDRGQVAVENGDSVGVPHDDNVAQRGVMGGSDDRSFGGRVHGSSPVGDEVEPGVSKRPVLTALAESRAEREVRDRRHKPIRRLPNSVAVSSDI